MLKVKVYATRYFAELPAEDHTLLDMEDLESLVDYVLHSEEHYVHTIECPARLKTFKCQPPRAYKAFIEYATEQLKQSEASDA